MQKEVNCFMLVIGVISIIPIGYGKGLKVQLLRKQFILNSDVAYGNGLKEVPSY